MNQNVYEAIGTILKAKQMELNALAVFLPEPVRVHGKAIGREIVQMGIELAGAALSAAVQTGKYAKTAEGVEPEKKPSANNDKNKAQNKGTRKGVSKIFVE